MRLGVKYRTYFKQIDVYVIHNNVWRMAICIYPIYISYIGTSYEHSARIEK